MVILGIDPGTRFAGFGVLKKDGSKVQLIDHGCLILKPSDSLVDRVGIFHSFFEKKIITLQITDIALETPFLGKNAQNFLKLGYLRGILYLLAHVHHSVLHEFSPSQVKQALTGFGGASKDQLATIILRLFPQLNNHTMPLRLDITDAIAVTLCGLWHKQKSTIFHH